MVEKFDRSVFLSDVEKITGSKRWPPHNPNEKVIELLNDYLKKFPREINLIKKLIVLKIQLKNYKSALEIINLHLGTSSVDLNLIFFKLYCLVCLEEIEEAKKCRNYYKIKRDPHSRGDYFAPHMPYIVNNVGWEIKHFMEFGELSQTYLKNLDSNEDSNNEKMLLKSKSYIQLGKFKEALEILDSILNTDSDNVDALDLKIGILTQIGTSISKRTGNRKNSARELALECAEKILEIDPTHELSDIRIRIFLGKLGRFNELETHLNKSKFKVKTTEMIDALLGQSKFHDALEIINTKLELDPEKRLLLEKRITIKKILEKNPKEDYLRLNEELEKEVVDVQNLPTWERRWKLFCQANNLVELGKFEEALKLFDEVDKLKPNYSKTSRDMVKEFLKKPELFKIHQELGTSIFYSVEYDEKRKILKQRFNAGSGPSGLYEYFDVPKEEYELIIKSKGIDYNFKRYKYKKHE